MRTHLLLLLIVCLEFTLAGKGPETGLSPTETVDDKKAVRKVWGNVLSAYEQARNAAKIVVKEMRLTAAMAHSMESMLIAWERVAQKTEYLLTPKTWKDLGTKNPIELIENLEEDFFRETDDLIYTEIPSALGASRRYENVRGRWVRGVDGIHEPVLQYSKKKMEYLVRLTGLSPGQKKKGSREKAAHETRTKSLAVATAKNDVGVISIDNKEARMEHIQKSLGESGDEGGSLNKEGMSSLYQVGSQTSENGYFLRAEELSQKINNIEVLSHIQSASISGYARANTMSYLMLFPLHRFSEEVRRLSGK